MIEVIRRIIPTMPLKEASDAENVVVIVKNEDVHENDVLMGRGGKNNKHIGNERLRDVARGHVDRYQVSTKKIKSAISRDIVKQTRRQNPPGRFLKRTAETGDWEDVGDYLAREKVAQVLRDAVCEATEVSKASQAPALQDASAHIRQTGTNPLPLDGQTRAMPPGLGSPMIVGQPPSFRVPYPWYPYSQHVAFPGPPHSPFPPGYRPSHPHAVQIPHPPGPPHLMRLPTGPLRPFMQAPPGAHPSNEMDPSARPGYSICLSVAQDTVPETTRTEAVMSWHPPVYATPSHKRGQPKRTRSLPVDGESEDKASPKKKNAVVKASSAGNISESQTPLLSATTEVMSDANFPPPLLPPVEVPVAAPVAGPAGSPALFVEPHCHQYARFEPSTVPPQPVMRAYSAPLPEIDPSNGFLSDGDSCHSVDRNWPGRPTESVFAIIEPLPVIQVAPDQIQRHPGIPGLRPPPQQGYRVTRRQNGKSDRQSAARTPTGETTEEGFEWFQGQLLLESDEDSEEETPQTPFPI